MEASSHERVMRRLYEISTEFSLGFARQMSSLLQVGCEHFGMEIGIQACVSDGEFILEHLHSGEPLPLEVGQSIPVSDTLADLALQQGGPVGCGALSASRNRNHPGRIRWGIESYLGAPVVVDGEVYGTLSFSSRHARPDIPDKDLDLLGLMASWLAVEIQRHQSQERLQKAEQSFRLGVEASPAAMLMIDDRGLITYANSAAQELFGYRYPDLFGSAVEMLVPVAVRAEHAGHRAGFAAEGGGRAMGRGRLLHGLHSSGRRIPVEVGLNTVETPYGSFTLCTILDRSRQEQFEREVQDYTQRLEVANRTLSDQAFTDDLTGLFNRRALFSHLEMLLRLARRDNAAVSLLLLDVDHFKEFNDAAGHQAGDEALRRVGEVMKDAARRSDIAARYGGEEFMLVLPGTDQDGARELAERIRLGVAAVTDLARPLTVSVGVATTANPDPDATAPELAADLIGRADRSLYRAKNGGRNRVVCDRRG